MSGSCRASRMVPVVFLCDVVVAFHARKTSHQHPRTTDISHYLSHHRRMQTPANVPCCACTAASCERLARSCGDSCWLSSGTELLQRCKASNARETRKRVPHHHIHHVRRRHPALCRRAVLAVLVVLVCVQSCKILLDPSRNVPLLALRPLSALTQARRAAGRLCS